MSTVSRTWWNRENRPYDHAELQVDAAVHVAGLVIAAIIGGQALYIAASPQAAVHFAHMALYVGSLLAVLSVSMAFNQWPPTPFKMHLARLDQASIFLFMAGSCTPFLALLAGTATGSIMMTAIWAAALIGVTLKLWVPHRFGRIAIAMYLAFGWSGLIVFSDLARLVPNSTILLLLAGGVVYSLGVGFHLWERLRFQNALWHLCVVTGASFHLWATLGVL